MSSHIQSISVNEMALPMKTNTMATFAFLKNCTVIMGLVPVSKYIGVKKNIHFFVRGCLRM